MTQLTITIDDALKTRAEEFFGRWDFDLPLAVDTWLRQTVRRKKKPFDAKTAAAAKYREKISREFGIVVPEGEEDDPFYSVANMRALQASFREADEGKFIYKTLTELLAMEKE
ncbi:MAG: hypothetical protein LBP75_03370 [Planctomycetota bacterium]|jgi:DNA-damage-inducible protein J|nr:hypothetical protein [Planctomycetota bacterium]